MWFIGVEVEQETSAPPPKKNPGSAPARSLTQREAIETKDVQLAHKKTLMDLQFGL